MHCLTRKLILHAIALVPLAIAPGYTRAQADPAADDHRAVVTRVAPVYPELAKRMHVSGVVLMRAIVLPNGTVSEIHTQDGHPLLRTAAEDAVRHWRFASGTTSSYCIVSVNFELPR